MAGVTATTAQSKPQNGDGQPARKRARKGRRRGGRGRRTRGGGGLSSSSESDSDSDSDSSDDDKTPATLPAAAKGKGKAVEPVKQPAALAVKQSDQDSDEDENSSSDESTSSSSSSSSSSFLTTSDDEIGTTAAPTHTSTETPASIANQAQAKTRRARSPVPPEEPPLYSYGLEADTNPEAYRAIGKPILWGLLPGDNEKDPSLAERELEEKQKAEYARFREHYVSRMIQTFGGSLDEIRKKESETLTASRLQVLIKSIADGADYFTSKNGPGIWKVGHEDRAEREMALEALPEATEADGMDEDA